MKEAFIHTNVLCLPKVGGSMIQSMYNIYDQGIDTQKSIEILDTDTLWKKYLDQACPKSGSRAKCGP